MRVGISLTSAYAVSTPRDGARWMVERTQAAHAAGLDSLFVGDHHATPIPYYQNTAILGRLIAEWGDRPVGALYLLPLHHPVLVAEQVGTLASIAPGRFILQCAIGPDDNQFPAMAISARQRPSRFEQALAIMRGLWAGETISDDGHWPIREARISPLPPEPVEVWIGAMAPPAIDRAARLGDGWLASPGIDVAESRRQLALYLERCEAHGRIPGTRAIRRDVYVGVDAAEAAATGGAVVAAGYRGFAPDVPIVGNVEHVAGALSKFAELGYTDVIVRNLVGDQRAALGCIERLAEVRERVG
jgi:alkanesulfonate monooxygenase SsuD/methylene tetrahydromethanopterin reductase-like flavin-dependent oxidoreductase (luciferase family)